MTTEHFLKDYTPSPFEVESIHLKIDIHDHYTHVTNTLKLIPQQDRSPTTLTLNGVNLVLEQIRLNGQLLTSDAYTLTEETLTLHTPPHDHLFTLEIQNRIHPQDNKACYGLYATGTMLCTQCESEGFRHITYMLDRPDVMTVFTTEISASESEYPVLLSNGNLIKTERLPSGRHTATWHDPFKKPCYLFAMVAGKLAVRRDHFITQSGRKVMLEIYSDPVDIAKTDYAMQALKRAMRWDETRFGREYDLDIYMIVAAADFNMGAMENKGLNIFNTKYILANDRISTDLDYQNIEMVIGHEYFHNWTGNRITCRDWFQLTLKEGLTVFRDEEFTSDLHDRTVKRIEDVKIVRNQQFAEDASPMAHPIQPQSYIEINNFYTPTVYEKGAEVIRMIYTLSGQDGFRKGMDLYFERHDGQAVTCDHFVSAIADANALDLTQFKRWYWQAGTPRVQAKGRYDSTQKSYTLEFTQHTPPTADGSPKEPLVIPIKTGLLSPQGKPLSVSDLESSHPDSFRILDSHECLLILKDAQHTFTFFNIPETPIPSLLRDFSAPVILNIDINDAELSTLMAHDPNYFNRWEAGQQLAIRTIFGTLKDPSGYSLAPLTHAFGILLEHHTEISPDFLAEALQLPSLSALIELQDILDFDRLVETYQQIEAHLARAHAAAWIALYQQLDTSKTQRKLKNTALQWVTVLQKPTGLSFAHSQFMDAQEMTSRLGAFKVLAHSKDVALADEAIRAFYEAYQDEPLAMDKWLSIQASSPRDGLVERLNTLLSHPAYIATNPNKIYALVGTFGSNLIQFHHRSGAGYRWLADRVIDANQNPQVAARMVKYLIKFRKFDVDRQNLMKAELQRILAIPDLAKDVHEIITKSL